MAITKEQALELADKYLLYTSKVALRDNITVSKGHEGSREVWRIEVKTTPIIMGMRIETMTFLINVDTGEVSAVVSQVSF